MDGRDFMLVWCSVCQSLWCAGTGYKTFLFQFTKATNHIIVSIKNFNRWIAQHLFHIFPFIQPLQKNKVLLEGLIWVEGRPILGSQLWRIVKIQIFIEYGLGRGCGAIGRAQAIRLRGPVYDYLCMIVVSRGTSDLKFSIPNSMRAVP